MVEKCMLITSFHSFVVISTGFWDAFLEYLGCKGDDGFTWKVKTLNVFMGEGEDIKCLVQTS